jgi:hypothetical protein
MEQPHSEENVRDLLDRRERELMQQIELLQSELAALRNDLTPKEVELIEVRRAKATLGMSAASSFVDAAGLPRHSDIQPINRGIDPTDAYRSMGVTIRDTPHRDLKIKELLLLAFVEHFQHHGAAPADLKAQILTSYGREIDPGSIRPNLARLREVGIVMRAIPPKWVLQPEAARIVSQTYFGNDLLRFAAALAWKEDNAAPKESNPTPQERPQTTVLKVVGER